MIVIDTHVWLWWISSPEKLAAEDEKLLAYPHLRTIWSTS